MKNEMAANARKRAFGETGPRPAHFDGRGSPPPPEKPSFPPAVRTKATKRRRLSSSEAADALERRR